MQEWLRPWEDGFVPSFWSAKNAMLQAAGAAFERHGVREGQQFVLMCLWREDGLSPGEIAGRLGLATPTVTRTVTRMEGSGLVERHPHPTDARLVSVRLTERGRGLRTALDAEMNALSERALQGFGEEERRAFTRMLDALTANLRAGR
ncbi:MarR family winged helix-turn-helix transcriptional regulator [Nocardiopsis composta]|uniref:DNA-binding MarR family transcriptional regulator n=1 Tax=Nocardiopsis composta TaxID=157465 RepID=A0A7W8QME3_9ACTN|nr:MarR family transcriptional regulator [Nocardiopsis composta]MBB5432480.1 DNA-binding MarR family transcriptional regulator [Nocardiopsis composta]